MCNKDLDQDLYKDQGKDKNYQLWLNLDKNLDQDLVNTVSTSKENNKIFELSDPLDTIVHPVYCPWSFLDPNYLTTSVGISRCILIVQTDIKLTLP